MSIITTLYKYRALLTQKGSKKGGYWKMKKIFVPLTLCFLFLTPVGISVAEGRNIQNSESLNTFLRADRTIIVFRNVLARLDAIVNATPEEELRDNNDNVRAQLRREIPANADIRLLNALRRSLHARALREMRQREIEQVGQIEQNLPNNFLRLLRVLTEHDAVALEFYERWRN
jgi:hypothetical protein